MKVSCKDKNRTLIVEISGEIDHCTAEEIKYKIDKEYTRLNSKNILFDFKNVSFMDSSGIGVIMGRYKKIQNCGGIAAAVSISDEIKRIFEISGLFKIINCYENIDEALKTLAFRG